MYETTKAAISHVADFDTTRNVWKVRTPLQTSFKVPYAPGEGIGKVAADFRVWCWENNLGYRVIGDGDLEGYFYVEGLRAI
jgi:hypothetical protein